MEPTNKEIKVPFKAYKGVIVKNINGVTTLTATVDGNPNCVFQKENKISDDKDLRLCSNTGFHFSLSLKDAVGHVKRRSNTVFYEIEVTGQFLLGDTKGITKEFKLIRALSDPEIDKIIVEERIDKVLATVQKMQKSFPYTILGGSLALYLYGARLDRFKDKEPDIDLSVPFYYGFEELLDTTPVVIDGISLQTVTEIKPVNKKYGNDFDYSLNIDNTNVDIKIDPSQRYQVISHKDFKYKVALLPVILAAKAKYALQGNEKHNDDLMELISNTTQEKPIKEIDLPF